MRRRKIKRPRSSKKRLNEDMAADKPEKKIRKAASDKSVVAKPEEDFEEFAPVDISELGD